MDPATIPGSVVAFVLPIGSHCILELYGCPATLLSSREGVQQALQAAARAAGAHLVEVLAHGFEPRGVTALGLLAESHVAIHTWPEVGYAACDVFTCGAHVAPEQACLYLAQAMQAEHYTLKRLPRGGDPNSIAQSGYGSGEPA